MSEFTPSSRSVIACELPGCGRVTHLWRFSDGQIWLDKDANGTPRFLNVCPEHKAAWLRMVSDFLEGPFAHRGAGVTIYLDRDGTPTTREAEFEAEQSAAVERHPSSRPSSGSSGPSY